MAEPKILQQRMAGPLAEQNDRWDKLWATGEKLAFDRGLPSPALVELLTDKSQLVGPALRNDGSRRRVLVPGCGRGYDVLLFASRGFDAVGLEVSPNAVKAAKAFAEEHFADYKQRYDAGNGTGAYEFIEGDFFKDSWVKSSFDVVYDYTFFCALRPEMRPAWAHRYSELLSASKDSRMICLEFPLAKDPASSGPPFGLKPDFYVAHLSAPGIAIPYDATGNLASNWEKSSSAHGKKLERMERYMPTDAHEAGKGTEHISIWRFSAPSIKGSM